MQRVMIIGAPGSGKSTLARQMGRRLNLPVYHTDMMTWAENWVERSNADRSAMAAEVEAQDAWVFEGGLSGTYENRLARADVLIWLDLPIALRFWRITMRVWHSKGRNRPDMPNGCVEALNAAFLGFVHYVWKTRKPHRAAIVTLIAGHEGAAEIVHPKSPGTVKAFLANLPNRDRQ